MQLTREELIVSIRRYLKTENLTQVMLAEQIGIAPTVLWDVLNNRRSPPATLLDYFGVERRVLYVPKLKTRI